MAKKSGIRINQIAKELGIPSTAILDKLKAEEVGDLNHQSTVSLGLAETIRSWFSRDAEAASTAVEIAAPVDVEAVAKPKTRRKPASKKTAAEEGAATDTAVAVETVADETAAKATATKRASRSKTAKASPDKETDTQTPAAASEQPPAESTSPTTSVTQTLAPVAPPPSIDTTATIEAPQQIPAPIEPVTAPQIVEAKTPPPAAAVAVPAAAASPQDAPVVEKLTPQQVRPTIRLGDRPQDAPATAKRKPVAAPKPFVPAPAKLQGPKVVREEKPDIVPAPRSRRPGQMQQEQPSFTQARPQQGRGVRVTTDEEDESADKKAATKARSLSSRRRSPDGRRGEAEEKLREFTDADLIERRERLAAAGTYRSGVNSHLKQKRQVGPSKTIVQKGEPVRIEEPITVRSLSEALGLKSNSIISHLMKQGVFATVNQALDTEISTLIAAEYGIELQIRGKQTLEEVLVEEIEQRPTDENNLKPRPPVVTILGHVDHGKTSLLDKIRSANIAAGEAGGITQHTAAWMVEVDRAGTKKRVTFIDTPGHQAFTSMRARGANMTDVVVLVVSAAEGVQPQTIESINHAKAAEVPIVVAMNKIDRPDANEQKVLGELAANGLNPVEWGGDIEVVRTSALTGQGIEDLIEILDYQAELLELKSDPTAPARGTVIESRVDSGLGPVATVLVQDGTLHVGDIVLSGNGYGRIRSLINDRNQPIEQAGASTPVIISGLDILPNAGDKFYTVADIERARAIASERETLQRQQVLAQKHAVTLDNFLATMQAGEVKTINLIIKADVQGSVETLQATVAQHNTEEVRVRVIHAAVGAITESDVELAYASGAVIIGFQVVPDEAARAMAEQRRVELRTYRVIYEIFDDLKKALSGMLEPEIREKLHGHAEVRQVFKVSRLGNIAGCMVTDGHIQRGSKVRLIRDGVVITEDLAIDTLRRVKDDVREVKAGFECGIKLAGYDDVKIGDRFEAYIRETIERHL
ncbi:MAG: translation initiation factor IF-2 [Phycisphaerales bacterium]|nr:translation initiation factor IF-2 [Phycisphaerales bacterium]